MSRVISRGPLGKVQRVSPVHGHGIHENVFGWHMRRYVYHNVVIERSVAFM